MNEEEFIALVDCEFPYHNPQERSRLIDLACQISPNAALTIAYELVCPPFSKRKKLKETLRLELLNELEQKFDHPIKPMIFSICRQIIKGQAQTGDYVLEILDQLRAYQDQYPAANIVCYSYYIGDDDSYEEQIEDRYQDLIQFWRSRAK